MDYVELFPDAKKVLNFSPVAHLESVQDKGQKTNVTFEIVR